MTKIIYLVKIKEQHSGALVRVPRIGQDHSTFAGLPAGLPLLRVSPTAVSGVK